MKIYLKLIIILAVTVACDYGTQFDSSPAVVNPDTTKDTLYIEKLNQEKNPFKDIYSVNDISVSPLPKGDSIDIELIFTSYFDRVINRTNLLILSTDSNCTIKKSNNHHFKLYIDSNFTKSIISLGYYLKSDNLVLEQRMTDKTGNQIFTYSDQIPLLSRVLLVEK